MDRQTLLKVKDVAAILGISKASAYRLMRTQIPAVRFGRTVRVRQEDLERFILLCSQGVGNNEGGDMRLVL